MATANELLTKIQGAAGVIQASLSARTAVDTGVEKATLKYLTATEGVAASHAHTVVIDISGSPEVAYWLQGKPEVLQATPTGPYMSGRTVGGWDELTKSAQEAAIHSFLSQVWRDSQTDQTREDIRSMQLTPTGPNTLKVSGDFHTGVAWEPKTYYVHLVDADGSVAVGDGNLILEPVV